MKLSSTLPSVLLIAGVLMAGTPLVAADQVSPDRVSPDRVTTEHVVETYAAIAYRNYSDSVVSAKALQQAIASFTAKPSAAGLAAARTAWLAAREDYGPTEVFRFYGGPIDADPENVEVKINGWPLDEQWVDYTVETPNSGIVNDAKDYPALTPDLLVELNEKGGEKNIAAGYHAIEFLLWGQDRSKVGPGDRPYTDYVDGGTAQHQDRRRSYLNQAATLLVKQLEQVTTAWDPAVAGNYRAQFLAEKPAEAAKKAFTGIIILAGDELSGERLAVAYETQDQEEEQSCFSDNTHRDTILNATGIQNIWLGHYKDIQGPGLVDLVEAANPQFASAASARITAAVAAAKSIPVPFDQAIMGDDQDPGRKAILATIENLEGAADNLVAAAKATGIEIEFGANANNAIVGLKEIITQLPAIEAAVAANDKEATAAAVDVVFDKWVRIETAVSRESPTLYKSLETAMNVVKNAAVRARTPNPAKVTSACAALAEKITSVLPTLKAAEPAAPEAPATPK